MGHYDSGYYGYDTHCRKCNKYLGMGIKHNICTNCEYFEIKEKHPSHAKQFLINEIITDYENHNDINTTREKFKRAIIDSGINPNKIIINHKITKEQEKKEQDPMYRIEQLEKRIRKLEKKE